MRPAVAGAVTGPRTARAPDPIAPDPPALPAIDLMWTALPDATGRARAVLRWPAVPNAVGYIVWEATEAAVRQAADPSAPSPAPGITMLARAGALRALITHNAATQARSLIAFTRLVERQITATQLELVLPGSADTLYAYRVSAIGATNLESARSSSVALVAVPRRIVPARPRLMLRVLPAGIDVIALPGRGPAPAGYQVHRVRRADLATDVGMMAPPVIAASAATWHAVSVPRDPRGTAAEAGRAITDRVPPSWYAYHYRVVALGPADPPNGGLPAESDASAMASAVLPPTTPPSFDLISVTANASNRLLRLRTDLPIRLSPVGRALLAVSRIASPTPGARLERSSVVTVAPDDVAQGTLTLLASPTAAQLAAMPEIRRSAPDATGRCNVPRAHASRRDARRRRRDRSALAPRRARHPGGDLMPAFADTVTSVGIAAWGGSMPVLSPTWTDGPTPAVNDAAMTLTLASGSWRALLAGVVMAPPTGGLPLTLLSPAGTSLAATGALVLALHPQAYLRLAWLYAGVLEDTAGARPERARGLPFRPVPRYVRYVTTAAQGGNVNPGDVIAAAGACSFHDAAGLPIDPLAVASAFTALMAVHQPLQRRALSTPFVANHQVKAIAALAGTPAHVRVRLADHAGRPHDGTRLRGLTALSAAVGLFKLNGNLTGTVSKAAVSTDFSEEQRRLLLLGPATSGRLGQSVSPPKLPTGVTLARDFLAVRVVELGLYLRGRPEPTWDGTKVHDQPEVRLNEPVALLTDGNDLLASASAALTGAPSDPKHVVAQAIEAPFSAPTTPGAAAHWPQFPPTAGAAATAGLVLVNLRAGFAATAGFRDDLDPATANVDVVVHLSGLPAEAHVRVYNRLFLADAREGRGDGAGAVAHGGTLTLLLRDPLRLRRPGLPENAVTIPSQAQLALDIVVVKRTGETRIFGNVTAPIAPPAPLPAPPLGGPNPFATAPARGVSNAGVLGLRPPPLPSATTDLLGVIRALTGEGQPRDASRRPTMAHRELIVAGKVGAGWQAVLSGGRLAAELHSADAQIGAPGGTGGRETQAAGLATGGGRLAWDLARAAQRRTTRIDLRLHDLAVSDRWTEPAAAVGPATATSGTIAAAALQTIAPACATPELALLRTGNRIDPNSTTRPRTFAALVDWLIPLVPPSFPFHDELVGKLGQLRGNAQAPLLFEELQREVMTSAYGRRDAQWALRDAIGRARRSIYIETPGFTPTQRDYAAAGLPIPPFAADLVTALGARLNAAPGLHVTICTPREPDFGPGYEPAAAYEARARRDAILGLPTANAVDGSRVVAFHPIGFPGRPSRLEATVVIVDDVWALVGACTLRRRGLTLDGSTDVVLTDMELEDGVCPPLREFRRKLLATRLGVTPTVASPFGLMPDPTWVRLADGVEAFHAIRERLRAGGLGRIDRLWTGETPGTTPLTPLSQALADPDGEEFNLAGTLALAALASLGTF